MIPTTRSAPVSVLSRSRRRWVLPTKGWLRRRILLALALVTVVAMRGAPTAGAADGDEARGRRPVRDLGRAAGWLLSDTWHVVTAPTRLDGRRALWLGGILAVGGILYAFDEDITAAVRRSRNDAVPRALADVGDFFGPVGTMGTTNKYYVASLTLAYATRWQGLQHISQEILASHLIAGLYNNVANVVVGRSRPFEQRGAYSFRWNDGTSFPSGHSYGIFQVATVLAHHIDLLPLQAAFFGIAGIVSYQRVEARAHWASDVFLSAAAGIAVSRAVIHLQHERHLRLVPTVTPDGGSVGLALRLGR